MPMAVSIDGRILRKTFFSLHSFIQKATLPTNVTVADIVVIVPTQLLL